MSASAVTDPSGKAAGRVTITSTLTSLIPPFFAIFVVVVLALLEIIDKETAGAIVLGILTTAGLTTGTVYQTAKKTPTDQYAVRTEVVAVPVEPEGAKAEAAEQVAYEVPAEPVEPAGRHTATPVIHEN